MDYQSPTTGNEATLVLSGLDESLINDGERLEKIITSILESENFDILEKVFHKFDPQGYTGMWLLSESHATFHTYPEHNAIYFGMYSCRGPVDCRETYFKLMGELAPKKAETSDRRICLKDSPNY